MFRYQFPVLILASVIICLVLSFVPLVSQNHSDLDNSTFENYKQFNGVIHLQTPISGGTRTIDDYIKLASQNNIDILIITDHDNLTYEYAVHALRWLINKEVEKPSVLTLGVQNYINKIKSYQNNNILVIGGVESSPFYYWTGSFQVDSKDKLRRRELTLNERGKHMLVIGLNDADSYEDLPIIATGRSNYDAYHGNQLEKPYQDLIDYVKANDGLTFWAHPEADEKRMIKGISIRTPSYSASLLNTTGYTGFGVLEEGYQKVGRIGGVWDKVLKEYCRGKREAPVWAIGELDDYGKKRIDYIQTVFLLKQKSRRAALDALRYGKIYTVLKKANSPMLKLETFTVCDIYNPKTIAYSGDEIKCNGNPMIKIKLLHEPPSKPAKATIKLIRNGKLIKEYNESLPFEITFKDDELTPGEKTYYRLDITDEFGGKIISNPVFVLPPAALCHYDPK